VAQAAATGVAETAAVAAVAAAIPVAAARVRRAVEAPAAVRATRAQEQAGMVVVTVADMVVAMPEETQAARVVTGMLTASFSRHVA
jgi:hypothetical protein